MYQTILTQSPLVLLVILALHPAKAFLLVVFHSVATSANSAAISDSTCFNSASMSCSLRGGTYW